MFQIFPPDVKRALFCRIRVRRFIRPVCAPELGRPMPAIYNWPVKDRKKRRRLHIMAPFAPALDHPGGVEINPCRRFCFGLKAAIRCDCTTTRMVNDGSADKLVIRCRAALKDWMNVCSAPTPNQ